MKTKYLSCTAADIYGAFVAWWEKNVSKKVPSRKRFGNWMSKRADIRREKVGTYIYDRLTPSREQIAKAIRLQVVAHFQPHRIKFSGEPPTPLDRRVAAILAKEDK